MRMRSILVAMLCVIAGSGAMLVAIRDWERPPSAQPPEALPAGVDPRSAGVPIGKVDRDGRVKLDPDLASPKTFACPPRTICGETHVELTPGSSRAGEEPEARSAHRRRPPPTRR
jgi:hypothetical protein